MIKHLKKNSKMTKSAFVKIFISAEIIAGSAPCISTLIASWPVIGTWSVSNGAAATSIVCWPRRSAITTRWSPRLSSSRQAKRNGTSAVEQGRPLQHYILVKSVSSDLLLKVGEVCRLRLESKAVDKRVPRNWQSGQPDVGSYVEVSASRIDEKFCEDLTRSPRPIAGLSVNRQESTITRRALNVIPSA